MTPDYSKYSLADLRESLSVVDGRRYPENKAAIEAEIQARKDSGAYAEEEKALGEERSAQIKEKIEFARKAQPVIAWYLIVTGSFLLVSQVLWPPAFGGFGQMAILALGLVYMLGTVIGGVALLKGKDWGTTLVIGLLFVQLVKLTSPIFGIKAVSALGLYVTFEAEWTIGISGDLGPEFSLAFGTNQPFLLGINLFVTWLIYLLVTATDTIEQGDAIGQPD